MASLQEADPIIDSSEQCGRQNEIHNRNPNAAELYQLRVYHHRWQSGLACPKCPPSDNNDTHTLKTGG